MEDKKLNKIILLSSIILFVLSLTQKCFCTTTQCSDSVMVFLLGWAALFSGAAGLSWLANPLLIAAWLLLRKNLKVSMFMSVFAFLLSLFFLLIDSVVDNENGGSHQVIAYKPGYWLWLLSSTCMLFGTFILMLKNNNRVAAKEKLSR